MSELQTTKAAASRRMKPPFRADHVGSLLRPRELLEARERFAEGRLSAEELRAVEDEAIRLIVGKQEEIGLAVGHRRRIPPRLVAHGLHLPARRHHQGGRAHRGQVLQRGRRGRVHAGRTARRREAGRLEDDLRRRLRLPQGVRDDERAETDDPLAEHGPLPRRKGSDRPRGLPRPRFLLGRPDRGVRRRGTTARRARLYVPPVRRHEPRVHERPAPA